MALKVDPFVQRRLLDVARLDQAIGSAQHRRRTLPELAADRDHRAAGRRPAQPRGRSAQAEIGDLDRATRKLDAEIEAVRARAARDQHRLADGLVPPKDLANLQNEIVSLSRRQATLEDEELELMERRETAAAALAEIDRDLERARAELAAAEQRRDDAFADIDDELARSRTQRERGRAAALPADLLTLYERIRSSGRIAAARLNGLPLRGLPDGPRPRRAAEIHGAGVDAVVRCTECGAILDPFVSPPDPAATGARRRSSPTAGPAAIPVRPATARSCWARTARCSPSAPPRSAAPPTTSPSTPACIAGLQAALRPRRIDAVSVRMDSKLVVEQMSGRWKVKHPDMKPLARQAAALVAQFDRVDFEWVPRAQNSHADRLANEAMDAAADGRRVDARSTPAAADPRRSATTATRRGPGPGPDGRTEPTSGPPCRTRPPRCPRRATARPRSWSCGTARRPGAPRRDSPGGRTFR